MSNIAPYNSNYNSNLYSKYAEYKTADTTKTNTKELAEDQKNLISWALNHQFVNPKFKMKHFVTSGQMTPYNTLRQYLLELKTIEEACERFENDIEAQRLEIEIAGIRIEREEDVLKKKELELAKLKTEQQYIQNKRRVQQYYIEREQWTELIQDFLESPLGKTADGRSLMEIFGTPEEDSYERHYWIVRLAKQASMDISSYGRISAGNLDAITQMPEDMIQDSIALAHEYSLRVDSLSNSLRGKVHQMLLENDPQYRENLSLSDRSKEESITNQDTPPKKPNDLPTDNQDLLDVYNS